MAFDPTSMKTLPTCEEVEKQLRELRATYEARAKEGRPRDPRAEGEWYRDMESRRNTIKQWEHLRSVVCGDKPRQEQKTEPPPSDVTDEGSGLDIPTIRVPGVASMKSSSGPGAPTKSPFAAAPRPLLYMVPIVVVLLVAAAVRMAGNSPQVAAESAAPTTTSAPAVTQAAAIPTTTSRPPSGAPVYRVTAQTATYSGGPKCSNTFVNWSWTIEGLGDTGSYTAAFGDTAEAGPFTIRPGTINDRQTWDPATHKLTLKDLVGISGGDTARIIKVNNTAITGDGLSKPAAPVTCTQ